MEHKSVSKRSIALRFKRFSGKAFSPFHSMHRVINIGVLAGLTLGTVAVDTADAQQQRRRDRGNSELEKELEEVTVTASKIATPLNQVARHITVISSKEIASAPVRSLQDLLVYSAGVDVQQRGGHGVQADISIRGGSFDQNAILLNGVNLSNPETGHLSYDVPINLSDIERIEIIHGASGLIYGSAAFSGGINIITKKDAHERLFAQITYGQHKTHHIEGRAVLQTGKSSHSISIGHKGSDGYTDNTDYKQLNILAQSNLHLSSTNKLQAQIGFNDKKYGANAFYSAKYAGQYDETDNFLASIKGELGTERLRIVPILYYNKTHDHYLLFRNNPKAYENFHSTENYGGNLIFSYHSSLGITTLGGELRRESIRSNRLGIAMTSPEGKYDKSAHRTNASISLEHSLQLGEHFSASAGLLVNHNTQREGIYEWLPSLSATYRPSRALALSASWSKGVRIPTFIDLFYSSPVQQGNTDLKAEHSQSLELSGKYRHHAFDAYLTLFGLWGTDMIDWTKALPTDAKYQPLNIGSLDTYGIETGLRLRLGHLVPKLGQGTQLKLDYAYMTQDYDSKGAVSMYTERYLRNKFTARLDLELFKGLTSSWSLRWQKRMGVYESGANTYSPYPAFATLDLRLDYKVTKQLGINLQLNNLTGTKYFDYSAVIQPGFWANIGISYRLTR